MEGKEIQKINSACESLKEKIWMLELERDEAQRELKSETRDPRIVQSFGNV